jgi:hypothetical protein
VVGSSKGKQGDKQFCFSVSFLPQQTKKEEDRQEKELEKTGDVSKNLFFLFFTVDLMDCVCVTVCVCLSLSLVLVIYTNSTVGFAGWIKLTEERSGSSSLFR